VIGLAVRLAWRHPVVAVAVFAGLTIAGRVMLRRAAEPAAGR